MVKVMDKTFAILEGIVQSSPRPSTPLELAERIGINHATCSRLLKGLLDSGYIIRHSRRQGYLPSPRILTLNNMAAFQEHLLSKARPEIDHCAAFLKNSVLIAQLYGGKRYVLYHRNGNPRVLIHLEKLCFDDIFRTATGLLLAAHLPDPERRKLFREQQELRAGFFNALRGEKDAMRYLDSVLEKDCVFCSKDDENQWIYAWPIYENGTFRAALGLSIPRPEYSASYHRKICKTLKETAEKISAELSVLHSIG